MIEQVSTMQSPEFEPTETTRLGGASVFASELTMTLMRWRLGRAFLSPAKLAGALSSTLSAKSFSRVGWDLQFLDYIPSGGRWSALSGRSCHSDLIKV